jgi:hypothetical protein
MRGLVVMAGVVAAALAGCGGEPIPLPPDPSVGALESVARDGDDLVVARVDGRPVHASCVREQAGLGLPLRAALGACIDLELLAAAALGRGLDRDPAVVEAGRAARVSRLIDLDFNRTVRSAADLPPALVAKAVDKARPYLVQPLRRVGVYVRATLPDGTVDGSPEEVAARALIEAVHAELAGKRALFPVDLFEAGDRIAAARGAKVDHDEKPYATAIDAEADRNWRAALFAIPEIGMISAPTRTKWGWDVVLWVDTTPARTPDEAALQAQVFPDLRRAYFRIWAQPFARTMAIEAHEERLRALVEDGAAP